MAHLKTEALGRSARHDPLTGLLLRNDALYAAKTAGRDRWMWADDR